MCKILEDEILYKQPIWPILTINDSKYVLDKLLYLSIENSEVWNQVYIKSELLSIFTRLTFNSFIKLTLNFNL